MLILVSHFHTLTVHSFLSNDMFQPNVAIIRFEYMFEVIALGQLHIYSVMMSQNNCPSAMTWNMYSNLVMATLG
jgi:hypothetical protein